MQKKTWTLVPQPVKILLYQKTEEMPQPIMGTCYIELIIMVQGQKLAAAEKFVYLGSTQSKLVTLKEEVTFCIVLAGVGFGRLEAKVWTYQGLSFKSKLKIHQAVVLNSILLAYKTIASIDVDWEKFTSTYSITSLIQKIQKSEMESKYILLKRSQLQWDRYVIYISNNQSAGMQIIVSFQFHIMIYNM